MMTMQGPDSKILIACVREKMPFGKYKGYFYEQLPVHYLEWMAKQGFPAGKTGMILATVYEIKINGLTGLFAELKKRMM